MIKRIWLLRFPGHVTSAVKPVNWNDVLFPKNIPSLSKFCEDPEKTTAASH
jgi:hypothetical protein